MRFRKTTAGACDSEKPWQERAIPKNHGRHVRFRKTTAGACDSEKPRQARQGTPGNPIVGHTKKASFSNKLIKQMDWKKMVCDFVIFKGVADVQLLGTSISKPRQAHAIPKNHGRRVRF
jgi:hypothetical protein